MILLLTALLTILLLVNGYATSNKTIGSTSLESRNKFKCFVCFWSENNDPCGDGNFTIRKAQASKYSVNCLACYKLTYFAAKGTKVKVLRGCAQDLPHYALRCQYIFNEDNSYMETCACASHYCNAGIESGVLRSRRDIVTFCWTAVIGGWILAKLVYLL